MDDVELDNERHKREEQERRAKRKVRRRRARKSIRYLCRFFLQKSNTHILCIFQNFTNSFTQLINHINVNIISLCIIINIYIIFLRHTALPNPAKPKKNESAKNMSNVSSERRANIKNSPPLALPLLRNGHPLKNHHHHNHHHHPFFNHSSINVPKAS